jgi:hypothetical protein
MKFISMVMDYPWYCVSRASEIRGAVARSLIAVGIIKAD